jgi:predicted Zn finger-like uncharacterized protein
LAPYHRGHFAAWNSSGGGKHSEGAWLIRSGLVGWPAAMLMSQTMNIVCPACSTRYAIADSAIGVDGRVVRCAKCRHSWFQEGPEKTDATLPPAMPAPPESETSPPPADTPAPPRETPPASGEAAAPSVYPNLTQTDHFEETPSSFAHEPPFRPRRHPATVWVMSAIVLALLAVAAVAAMATYGVPDWLPLPLDSFGLRDSFARPAPDLVLDFPASRQQPRPLPNGSRFFNVSGSVRNAGNVRRAVPTLLIVLRDARRTIVYVLETAPPKPVLAPGESETIDQAIIDPPSSARTAEIGWKPR